MSIRISIDQRLGSAAILFLVSGTSVFAAALNHETHDEDTAICGHKEHDSLEHRAQAATRTYWRAEHAANPKSWVRFKILGFNDFHGQLEPRTLFGRPVGGAAVLASYLRAETASADDGAIIVHSGDHVGATPPVSALLQDEPSISFLNMLANKHCAEVEGDDDDEDDRPGKKTEKHHAKEGRHHVEEGKHRAMTGRRFDDERFDPRCNIVGTLGNHEFDEGVDEMLRLINGGIHANGPFLDANYGGAVFPYVAANVVDSRSGKPLLPPYVIKRIGGVPVAFIGAVLTETPTIVTPTGVAGVTFLDEAESINSYVPELKARGVRAIVVNIHQGTSQRYFSGSTDPEPQDVGGSIGPIISALDDEIDIVVSGHWHRFTNALMANKNGKQILVTQAFSRSTAYADIDVAIDPHSRDIVEKSAEIATTWGDQGPGLSPDEDVAELVAEASAIVQPLVERVIGQSAADILRATSAAGESALGNLIADAQRAAMGTDIAFMNPGGIRADIAVGPVTWGELFTVQPFNNDLVKMELSGAQIIALLDQQWAGQPYARVLKASGIRYTWQENDPTQFADNTVLPASIVINGQPLDSSAIYTVTVNSFLAAGGDNFSVLPTGGNRVIGPVDLDALITHVQGLSQPFSATIEGRIQTVP